MDDPTGEEIPSAIFSLTAYFECVMIGNAIVVVCFSLGSMVSSHRTRSLFGPADPDSTHNRNKGQVIFLFSPTLDVYYLSGFNRVSISFVLYTLMLVRE